MPRAAMPDACDACRAARLRCLTRLRCRAPIYAYITRALLVTSQTTVAINDQMVTYAIASLRFGG
jgi:hypothetical protein